MSADIVSAVYFSSKQRCILFFCAKIFTNDSTPEPFPVCNQPSINCNRTGSYCTAAATEGDLQRTFPKVPGTPRSSPPGSALLKGVWTCRLLDGVHIVSLCDVATRRFTDEEEWLIGDKRGEFYRSNEDLRDGSSDSQSSPHQIGAEESQLGRFRSS